MTQPDTTVKRRGQQRGQRYERRDQHESFPASKANTMIQRARAGTLRFVIRSDGSRLRRWSRQRRARRYGR
jgi:hypothetical protein